MERAAGAEPSYQTLENPIQRARGRALAETSSSYPWPRYERCELGHEAHRRGGSGGFTAGFSVLLAPAPAVHGGFSAVQPEAGTQRVPKQTSSVRGQSLTSGVPAV